MKNLIDIHTILATPSDLEDIHSDPEAASDTLNEILHLVYDGADDDIDTQTLENMLNFCWQHWHQDSNLADIDVDDLVDWVDHLHNTWDNSNFENDI